MLRYELIAHVMIIMIIITVAEFYSSNTLVTYWFVFFATRLKGLYFYSRPSSELIYFFNHFTRIRCIKM